MTNHRFPKPLEGKLAERAGDRQAGLDLADPPSLTVRLVLVVCLVATLWIAGRYAPRALFLAVVVVSMNDSGAPLWRLALLDVQFLLPLAILLLAALEAILGLRRATPLRLCLAVALPAVALADAVFLSTAW